jgi:hypothetical protein
MARSNRNRIGSLIDNGVAALAAVGTGFATFAMPDALFARIVVSSHLPDFIAAAQPPLGFKARIAVVAVVAIVVYAFVWTLLRALDNVGRARPAPAVEPEAPRLRRADAHPDAPSRAPLLAGRDLGEPAFPEEAQDPEPEQFAAFEPEPEAEPLPPFLVPQPEPEPDFVAEERPEAEPAPAAAPEPAPASVEAVQDEQDEQDGNDDSFGGDDSLGNLMQRFETGLSRKQQALAAAPAPAAADAEPAPQERVGHRLRSAISDLNRISAQGG